MAVVHYAVCHTCGIVEYRPWSIKWEKWATEFVRKHPRHVIDFCVDELQEGEVVPWR